MKKALLTVLLLSTPAYAVTGPRATWTPGRCDRLHVALTDTRPVLDEDTAVFLDGRPVRYADVSADKVEITEVVIHGRHVEVIRFRTRK